MYPPLRTRGFQRGQYSENHMLSYLEDIATYRHWYFGHYHMDGRLNDKMTVLYREIVPPGGGIFCKKRRCGVHVFRPGGALFFPKEGKISLFALFSRQDLCFVLKICTDRVKNIAFGGKLLTFSRSVAYNELDLYRRCTSAFLISCRRLTERTANRERQYDQRRSCGRGPRPQQRRRRRRFRPCGRRGVILAAAGSKFAKQ